MNAPYLNSFARHETFHPRYGWMRKAVVATGESSDVFLQPDATVTLGVGKNMVRAIRYWALASRVVEEVALPGRPRLSGVAPSRLGEFLLGPDGVDPYLEEPVSLWLLHWQLVRRGSIAAVWYLAFNRFPHRDFADELLVDWLTRSTRSPDGTTVARSSVEKDVSCLLRMYGPAQANVPETLVSPFSSLHLVDRTSEKPTTYRITYGPKIGLRPALVAISAIDLMRSADAEARSIGIGRLASEAGSPGRAFGLSENEIASALEEIAASDVGLEVGLYAGARRLHLSDDPSLVVPRLVQLLYPRAVVADIDLDVLAPPSRLGTAA